MARIMRVEIEDIKTQFYYFIDFKQEYSDRMVSLRMLAFRLCDHWYKVACKYSYCTN